MAIARCEQAGAPARGCWSKDAGSTYPLPAVRPRPTLPSVPRLRGGGCGGTCLLTS